MIRFMDATHPPRLGTQGLEMKMLTDSMKSRRIPTRLSEEGRIALAELLVKHLNDKALARLVYEFESDVSFDGVESRGALAAHLEIAGRHTRSGNPVTRIFDGSDLIFEEVEFDE